MDHSRTTPGYEQADLALVLAAAAWGFPQRASQSGSPWERLEESWADRLRIAEERRGPASPGEALEQIHESLCNESRASLDEVHQSWWVRALQDESPAVRQLVAACGAPRVSLAARNAFGIAFEDLESLRCPDPEVASWVLALWSERLVGGEPLSDDDPPVIVALSGLAPSSLYRLAHQTGLAKLVLAEDPEGVLSRHLNWRARGDWYRRWFLERFGPDELRPHALAGRDVRQDAGTERLTDRRRLATLGLTTLARLLLPAEAYRVRWALQHVPYPVAKRIRSLMARNSRVEPKVFLTEAMILEAAWRRLALEGHAALADSGEERRPGDVA